MRPPDWRLDNKLMHCGLMESQTAPLPHCPNMAPNQRHFGAFNNTLKCILNSFQGFFLVICFVWPKSRHQLCGTFKNRKLHYLYNNVPTEAEGTPWETPLARHRKIMERAKPNWPQSPTPLRSSSDHLDKGCERLYAESQTALWSTVSSPLAMEALHVNILERQLCHLDPIQFRH